MNKFNIEWRIERKSNQVLLFHLIFFHFRSPWWFMYILYILRSPMYRNEKKKKFFEEKKERCIDLIRNINSGAAENK